AGANATEPKELLDSSCPVWNILHELAGGGQVEHHRGCLSKLAGRKPELVHRQLPSWSKPSRGSSGRTYPGKFTGDSTTDSGIAIVGSVETTTFLEGISLGTSDSYSGWSRGASVESSTAHVS